jgi:hypothetical protein
MDELIEQSNSTELSIEGDSTSKDCRVPLALADYENQLTQALQLYESAIETNDVKKKALALKNIGMIHSQLILKQTDKALMLLEFERALTAFLEAWAVSEKSEPNDWCDGIIQEINSISQELVSHIEENESDFNERFNFTQSLNQLIPENLPLVKANVLRSLVRGNLNWSLALLQAKDYKSLLKLLQSSLQFIEEGLRLSRQNRDQVSPMEEEISEELKEKQDSYIFLLNRAKALNEMVLGDDLLKKAIHEEENLQMDFIWQALGHYKSALNMCRERDIELEGKIHGRIGYVYHKVLRIEHKAKNYLQTSAKLALSLGRNMAGVRWFQDTTTYLNEIRNAEVKKEDEDYEKKRERFLKMYETELEELERVRKKSHQEFIKFILEKHMPRGQNFTLKDADLEVKNMKKTLLKVLKLYHPDKCVNENEGWCFLAGEITKHLTNIYGIYKRDT